MLVRLHQAVVRQGAAAASVKKPAIGTILVPTFFRYSGGTAQRSPDLFS
jgi:hypothetical protein